MNPIHSGERLFVMATVVDVSIHVQSMDQLRRQNKALLSVSEDLQIKRQALQTEAERRRSAQKEAEERTREIEQLLYVVSHDLKSPLVTLIGFAKQLVRNVQRERYEGVAAAAERIERAGRNMSTLIDDILELSRVGRAELQRSRIATRELLDEVQSLLHGTLQAENIEVSVGAVPEALQCDRSLMLQVFLNLVSNAIKYGCRDDVRVIEIGGDETEEEVRVWVRDHGPGIDPDYRERAYDLFQRLDTRREGTGLGLAIVKAAVERQGGRSWIESTDEQGGTTVWISLAKAKARSIGEKAMST